MTKNISGKGGADDVSINEDEALVDAEFFNNLDNLLKQFVATVTDLKQVHDQHLTEEYINSTSKVYIKADNLIEEVSGFELLKDISEDIKLGESDGQALQSQGVKLLSNRYPIPMKLVLKEAIDELKMAATIVMARGKVATLPMAPHSAQVDMLQSSVPCLKAVKKLVVISKDAVVRVRATGVEERRKREAWRKECLANEKVKHLFNMWESQVMNETTGKDLTNEEQEILQDSPEGILYDETSLKKIKGGKLIKLIEALTTHEAIVGKVF